MKEVLLTSSVLILALLMLRRVFRRTISRRMQYALWGLVLLRLLVPVNLPAIEHNVLTAAEPAQAQVAQQLEQPQVYVPVAREPLSQHPTAPDTIPEKANTPEAPSVWVASTDETAVRYLKLTTSDILTYIWYAGVAVMSVWLLLSNLRFRRRLQKNRTPYTVEGCKYPVYLCAGLPSPCLFGLFRPAIYLTPAAAASPESLRHVLAHESTHARHWDPLWSALRCVCLAVYWFDPLVWAAAYASKTDGELACDEGAMKLLGETERIPYGRTLLSLIPVRRVSDPLLSATTMTAGKRQLKDRIARIAENRQTTAAALFLVLALAAVVCAVTFTGAKKTAEPTPLTQEELAGFNDRFFGDEENAGFRCQFLTSLYEKPEDIDLYELLYNGTGLPEETDEAAIRQAIAAKHPAYTDMGIDMTYFSTSVLNTVLERYLDLSLMETSQTGMISFSYLPDYDVYYHFHGDTNAISPALYSFAAGEREGDLVKLYYEADGMYWNGDFAEGWACLTLREVPGEFEDGFPYRFVSHQLCERPEHLLGQLRVLTGQELKFFNEEFFNNDTVNGTVGMNIRNQFLTSLYTKPEDINLFELFYCGTGLHDSMTEEEWRQVGSFGSDGEEICPTDKLSVESMDRVLLENTGLTLTETQQTGLEYFQYLPEYNAYYNTHGDTNYFYGVQITAGTRENNTIRLYYPDSSARYDCDWLCVTLQEQEDGTYWFLSNQPSEKPAIPTVLPEGEPVLTIPLTDLAPYEPEAVAVERRSNDCAARGGGWSIDAEDGSSVSLRPYLSTDGNLYAAILFDEAAGRDGPSVWEAGCFFTFPEGNSIADGESTVNTSFFSDLFGHNGWQVSYHGQLDEHTGTTFTDYYYFQDEATPVLLARTHGLDPTIMDLDGDGANELVNADNQLFFQRDGKLYEADITALLEEHWPEMTWWDYTILDTDSRCLILRGFVEMPEWGENGQADFTRYVYFDGENLLLYSGLEETEDHAALSVLRGSVPEQVLADGKAAAQADYDYVKGNKAYVDGLQSIDDWRVSYLKQECVFTEFSCGPIEVYSLGYQFHAAEPGKVVLAGGMYVQEDGWVGGFTGFLKDSTYMAYQVREDGSRVRLESNLAFDTSVDSVGFRADLCRTLLNNGLIQLSELSDQDLLYLFCCWSPASFLNEMGESPAAQQDAVYAALAGFQESGTQEEQSYLKDALQTLGWTQRNLTEAGQAAYQRFQDILYAGQDWGVPSEELLHQTILDYRSSRTARRFDFYAEAHEVLDTSVSENRRQYTFYTLVYYNAYSITDGAWKAETGGCFPAAITFAVQTDGSWTLSDYQEETQGGDIDRLFPAGVADVIRDDRHITQNLAALCDEAAETFAATEKAKVQFSWQPLETTADPMTYTERWNWCKAGGDTEGSPRFAVSTAQADEARHMVYAGNLTGVSPLASAWKQLFLRFPDGALAELPLPRADFAGTSFMDTAVFADGKFIYSVSFPSEQRGDGDALIHLKGTYRYEVDLENRRVTLTVLDT
ncbi:M56 family metallopeptidase [uncultured Dysosmobacter sp.]|uniref:M56 family metallopeptidase n=1 Tax=uncultured Dysosmobacter sp. TaxID=2591384 RepID=UPI00262711BC|nr:M56 family metallopeptidase [uncultured Dysosmobacter sp.]